MGGATGARIGAASAKANLQKAACGTPTRWTQAQANAVGDTMIANKNDYGMQILAPEWERLDNQVRTCRGEQRRA